jgi:hypothetical protein
MLNRLIHFARKSALEKTCRIGFDSRNSRGERVVYTLSFFLILGYLNTAQALPRYSARNSQSCFLCHHSPSGGGMRSGYGSQYFAGRKLAVNKVPNTSLELLDTKSRS